MIEQCPLSTIYHFYKFGNAKLAEMPYRSLLMVSSSHTPASSFHFPFTPLLKHLPIRPLICLSSLLNRLVPAPLVIHKLLVLGFLRVQLSKAIALIVGRDVEGGLLFLAADDEGTADDTVIGSAVDRGAAEDIFARGFEAGEETTCGA